MRLEHHLVGGYVRYISPHIIIIIIIMSFQCSLILVLFKNYKPSQIHKGLASRKTNYLVSCVYLSVVDWEGQFTTRYVHHTANNQSSGHSPALRTGQHVQKVTDADREAVSVLCAVKTCKEQHNTTTLKMIRQSGRKVLKLTAGKHKNFLLFL